jgi:hypothetical protein
MAVDKMSVTMIELLGGNTAGQVGITVDQEKALYKLYEFHDEDHELMKAALFRNMCRCATSDGMRIVALLAKFCEPGKDPLHIVKRALANEGYDVHLEEEELDDE